MQLRPTKTVLERKAWKRFREKLLFLPFGTTSPKIAGEAAVEVVPKAPYAFLGQTHECTRQRGRRKSTRWTSQHGPV